LANQYKIYQVIPELYPHLVQIQSGVLYDGDGNLITVIGQGGGGEQGPQGPTGVDGIPGSVRNDSFSASSVTITHNFGYYPVVQVIDSAGAVVMPLSITHSSLNTYTVNFGTTVSGYIISGAGIRGNTGVTGPQGTNGVFGGTGPSGPQGFQGPTGGSILAYTYKTATYSITSDDYYVEAVGTFDINLPTATGATGKTYLIKNSGTGVITIGTTSSQLIDNLPSYDLAFYDTLVVTSNGTNWNVENTQTKTFTRVYNNTGSVIPKGSALKIQSTYNGIPAVTLPIASGTGSQQVIGLSLIDIPIASEGIAISAGILSGLNLASYSVGDILYLSDYVAGGFVNSTESLLYSSRTNQIGYVTSNSSTIGTLQVQINNEDINLSLTDIQRNILEGNVISGGIFQFPAPGITISSPTTLNISPMKGWIVDNAGPTTSIAPIATLIEYPGATGVTLSNITTATETYFLYRCITGCSS